MRTERSLNQYADAVASALKNGTPIYSFEEWYERKKLIDQIEKPFEILRRSELLQVTVTFRISATDIYQANLKADALLKKFEHKHSLEFDGKKVLTPEEQRQKLINQLEAVKRREQRAAEAQERKRQALLKQLQTLGV